MLTKNTFELRQLVEEHVAADQVIQGTYWDNEENKGCFIGCLNHSANPQGAEERFGLPSMIQRIAESIFERLSEGDAKGFFAALPEAVKCDDKDLSKVGWQFLAAQLRGLPKVPKDIQDVIDPVIEGMNLLVEGNGWAASHAARAAATARAAHAANSANSACADAASAALTHVDSVDASYASKQRDLLLKLISDAPVLSPTPQTATH